MKYALITVIVLMSWGQSAVGEPIMIRGAGAGSCGTWTKWIQHNAGGGAGNNALHEIQQAWVAGYWFAAQLHNRRNVGKDIDWDGKLGWINNYCQKNSTLQIATAATALWEFLLARELSR